MNILKPVLWLTLAVVLFGTAFVAVQQRKSSVVHQLAFDIQTLDNGKNLITDTDILERIERSFGYPLQGVPIEELEVLRVEQVLEADPFIQAATVFVDAQNVVHINIVQRQPMLRVIDKNGANYYLDAKGKKMPLSKHFAARVLVATGNIPPYTTDFLETKNKTLLYDLYHLTAHILEDDFLKHQIEQLYVNSLGEITMIPKIGDQQIHLGSIENYEEKLRRLKVFYKEGIPYIGWHKYEAIDLRYDGQVVAKQKSRRSSSRINA